MGRSVRVAPAVGLVAVVGVLAFVVLAELLAAPAPEADGAPDDDPATADTGATGNGVPAPLRPGRLLTGLDGDGARRALDGRRGDPADRHAAAAQIGLVTGFGGSAP